jgi:CheY-like chemotaxis protein
MMWSSRIVWQKGLEVFHRARPDVIVLDLKMPGMNGLTVLKQIRSLNPTQPVIVLTGAATPESEQQVRALGVTEMWKKNSRCISWMTR